MTIYLDNAATSYPKPESVYRKMSDFLRETGANPGRSSHHLALAAEREIAEVRLKIARLIGAQHPDEVIFTLNGTDALNLAIKGILRPGDHVITSLLEHNSVMRPLEHLRSSGVIEVTHVKFDSSGRVDPEDFRRNIRKNTKLIILTHASNVLGVIQPISDVGQLASEHGILFLVDAAQTAGAFPIDIREAKIDLLAAPGHKSLLGPPGTGFLFVGDRAMTGIRPLREGGTGGNSKSRLQPDELPFRLESGTPNTVGIAALGAALDYIEEQTIDSIHLRESSLIQSLIDRLAEIDGISLYPAKRAGERVGLLSLNIAGYSATEVGMVMDQSFDIAIRAGLHCAPYAHEALGTAPDGTVRVSLSPFTQPFDLNAFEVAVRAMVSNG